MKPKARYTLKFADGRTETLTLAGKALNRGADGAIYRSPDGRYALKYYHDLSEGPDRQTKVWQMILNPPRDTQADHFAWPSALLLNKRQHFVGFAMPLLDVGGYASLDMVLSGRGRKIESLPQANTFRLRVALNLAKRVMELHEKGHCIIDLKPANLLVHRQSGDVAVVDCDGFAVKGKDQFFPAHQFTLGFIAPEAFRTRQSPEVLRQPQDEFALAVVVFKLLNNGLHPFQGVPDKRDIPTDNQNRIAGGFYPYGKKPHTDIKPSPWSIHRGFPAPLRSAFDRSFTSAKRATAVEWVNLLEQAEQRLVQCSANSEHSYWGKRCPLCALADTRVKVKKPKPRHRQPALVQPRTRQNRAAAPLYRPPAAAQQPAPAPGPSNPGKRAAIFVGIVMIFAIIVIAANISDPVTAPANTPRATSPPPDTRAQPYNMRSPLLVSQYRHIGSAVYRERPNPYALHFRDDVERDPVPFYRIGPFDTPEELRLFKHSPLTSGYAQIAPSDFQQASLDMTTHELSVTAVYKDQPGNYGLEFWQPDVRGEGPAVYLPLCSPTMSCSHLYRLSPTEERVEYAFQKFPGGGYTGAPWRHTFSPDGEHLAMANANQVVIYAVDQPATPLAATPLPDDLHDYRVDALALTNDASRLTLNMSIEGDYGADFQSLLLELRRTGNELEQDDSFTQRALSAGTEVLGGYHVVSDDGQTLAVSEFQGIELNSTRYTRFGEAVTVAVGHPTISIWRRNADDQWAFHQRIEWGNLRRSSKIPVRGPRQAQGLLAHALAGGRLRGNAQPHQDFQLSPDGKRLVSGLETKEAQHQLTAHAYLFDISAETPEFLARLTSEVRPRPQMLRAAYPDIRLSRNGDYAAMGWFLYDDVKRGAELFQAYQIELFELNPSASTPAQDDNEPPIPLNLRPAALPPTE